MSETAQMSSAAMTPRTATPGERCRQHANDPNLPPEIQNALFEAAKALDWQTLVLTGLSQAEKDVVGALSQTIAVQQENIRQLQKQLHEYEIRIQSEQVRQQQEIEIYKHTAGQAISGPTQAYSAGSAQHQMLEKIRRQQEIGRFDTEKIDTLIRGVLNQKG